MSWEDHRRRRGNGELCVSQWTRRDSKAATPVPQSELSVNDRAIMLEQHDSYDVFTGQGLRDWQFHVIETVAGTSYVALWPMTSGNKKCR